MGWTCIACEHFNADRDGAVITQCEGRDSQGERCKTLFTRKLGDHRLSDETINHPKHYTSHPSGVECITIAEHFNFNLGNALKYLWRAGLKTDQLTDLRKAVWYLNREIDRLTKGKS